MSHLDSRRPSDLGLINNRVFPDPVKIRLEVVFGAPGKNCFGAGICRILSVEHVRVRWKCPSAPAWLILNSAGSINIAFDRSTLLPEFCELYFKDQVFQVEASYPIQKNLLFPLNMGDFTIEAGRYSVKVSEYFLTVNF